MKHYKTLLNNIKTQAQQAQPQQPDSLEATLIKNQLRERDSELARIRKQLAELEQARDGAIKDREHYVINNELVKAARKLNVKETAVDDIVSLVAGKVAFKDGKVIPVEKPDTDLEGYLKDWLGAKEHFLAPTAAPGTGAPPVAASPLPPAQELDLGTPEGLSALARSFGRTR